MALFVYVLTPYVETVKQLDFNRHFKLSRWSRSNASHWGARGPRFDSWLWQVFIWGFYVVLLLGFYLFVKKKPAYLKLCDEYDNDSICQSGKKSGIPKLGIFLYIKPLSHQSSILTVLPQRPKHGRKPSCALYSRVASNVVVVLCVHCAIA